MFCKQNRKCLLLYANEQNTTTLCSLNPWRKTEFFIVKYLFRVNNWNSRTRSEICSKLTIKTPEDVINPLSHTTLWTRGHVRSGDKLKTFYLHYHNTYGYQTWQGGYIQWKAFFYKAFYMTLQSRGLVNLIYLIWFVGLERRRLNRIQLIYLLL